MRKAYNNRPVILKVHVRYMVEHCISSDNVILAGNGNYYTSKSRCPIGGNQPPRNDAATFYN